MDSCECSVPIDTRPKSSDAASNDDGDDADGNDNLVMMTVVVWQQMTINSTDKPIKELLPGVDVVYFSILGSC